MAGVVSRLFPCWGQPVKGLDRTSCHYSLVHLQDPAGGCLCWGSPHRADKKEKVSHLPHTSTELAQKTAVVSSF